jgi:uncharacterized protein YgbK (DUF1537 family)
MSVPSVEGGLPAGPLLAFYGDDFTGSTDAMEVLTFAGLPTVLFLEPPTPDLLARFPDARAIGLAGTARSRDPGWMADHLPPAFRALRAFGAPLLHYKICSTFDSAPHVGSIGRAIEIGLETIGGRWAPVIVGAPRLGRYQAFGHLFAKTGDAAIHRIDRHPTMSRHPVTPMDESDLARHLGRQTALPIDLVDFPTLKRGDGAARLTACAAQGARIVLVDVLDEETLVEAGRLVWSARGDGLFTAASSGLQYALIAHWRARGWLAPAAGTAPAGTVPRIAVASGSCSPVTAAQIDWAEKSGFRVVRLAVDALLDDMRRAQEIERAIAASLAHLGEGCDPIVLTARGPADPAIALFEKIVAPEGRAAAQERLGDALGCVLSVVAARAGLARLAVAGGDSSGRVVGQFGVQALTAEAPLAPGVPLCRAWSRQPANGGFEIALKGGQVGGPDFFGAVRAGRPLG